MQDAYSLLIKKLSAFTQKYYQNLLIRGLILCFSCTALGFISFAVLEYYGRFGVEARTGFFWAFLILSTLILFFWVLRPLLKLVKLGERLSDDQAAKIIGKHFPDVADKLLNVIQLKKQSSSNMALLEAGINQKALELKPIPFVKAINFSENKRFIKYALIPFLIFAGLYAADREELLTESTARIIDYNTEYIPPAPFDFVILNDTLECIQHQDYKLSIQLKGEEIPTDAYLELSSLPIKMKKLEDHVFEYDFRNIQKSQSFKLNAGGIYSGTHNLNVLAAPSLINFELSLDYPSYTGKRTRRLKTLGKYWFRKAPG